ncbi:hypothetical protein HOG47_03070 [archaeon]|jgi:hypothetical protein|nr:hypothetical protein [archaeon]
MTEEYIHKTFEIINNVKKKNNLPWDRLLQDAADKMGINILELKNYIEENSKYKYCKNTKKYIETTN